MTQLQHEPNHLWQACLVGDLATMRAAILDNHDSTPILRQVARIEIQWRTPLGAACDGGNVDAVRLILDMKADVSQGTPPYNAAALFIASQNGQCGVAEVLLDNRANVNQACDANGITPLYIASQDGHCGVVEVLLANRANVNQACDDGVTALCVATVQGHCGVAEVLLDNRANVNHVKIAGSTPLHIAGFQGQLKVVQGLLANSASVHTTDDSGKTAFDLVGENVDADHAVTKYFAVSQEWSPLMHAIAYRKLSRIVELLRSDGTDPSLVVMAGNVKHSPWSLSRNCPPAAWSSEVCPDIVKLVGQALHWSPVSHALFGPGFRYAVRLVLLLRLVLEKQQKLPVLPESVWHKIIAWLPRLWGSQLAARTS